MYKTKCFYVLQHKRCDTLDWEGKIFFKEMIDKHRYLIVEKIRYS
jgi:hypothetical protein